MQRKFSHTRFLFLLIIVLNTLDTKEQIAKSQYEYRKKFQKDLRFCDNCFRHQIQHCLNIFEQILPANEDFSLRQLLVFLPKVSCKRNHQLIRLKNTNEKLITKYLFNENILVQWPQVSNKIGILKEEFFLQQENLQGVQYSPMKTVHNFIKSMQLYHTDLPEIVIWYYLLNNIQPLIFPILYGQNFPVPNTYAICGFTLYQQYAGQDLYNFFQTDFFLKLAISKQLLEAAIQFSRGFNGYRLYITDFTADNIVYNSVLNQIFFIDLDTIFIVDSSKAKYKESIHKHNYVECNGCFGYSAEEIASYNISDVNIFLICQFLREDLYKDQTKGFLYPLSNNSSVRNSNLLILLNKCVDCLDKECAERFTAANELIAEMKKILTTKT